MLVDRDTLKGPDWMILTLFPLCGSRWPKYSDRKETNCKRFARRIYCWICVFPAGRGARFALAREDFTPLSSLTTSIPAKLTVGIESAPHLPLLVANHMCSLAAE
jgi:hypothetical protein